MLEKCSSSHKSASPRELVLKSEGEGCEEGEKGEKTKGHKKLIRSRRWEASIKMENKEGGWQMGVRKGRRESPVFEAPKGALKSWRGQVKCVIHFPLQGINLLSPQHLTDSNTVCLPVVAICISRSYRWRLSCHGC